MDDDTNNTTLSIYIYIYIRKRWDDWKDRSRVWFFSFKLERAKRVKEIGRCVVSFQSIESNSPLHSCLLLDGNSKRYPDLCSPSLPSFLLHLGRSSPLLPLTFFPLRPCTLRTRRSPLYRYTGFAFYPWNDASSNPRKRDLLFSSRAPYTWFWGRSGQPIGPFGCLPVHLSLLRLLYREANLSFQYPFINRRFWRTPRWSEEKKSEGGSRWRWYICIYESAGKVICKWVLDIVSLQRYVSPNNRNTYAANSFGTSNPIVLDKTRPGYGFFEMVTAVFGGEWCERCIVVSRE